MLYDSTRSLLQTIVSSLETSDETRWDDQTEAGNSCLYEMHQMSSASYKPYRPDKLNSTTQTQSKVPGKLINAIPHVRTMVIAIRHKDKALALESGRAALAELNSSTRTPIQGKEASAERQREKGRSKAAASAG